MSNDFVYLFLFPSIYRCKVITLFFCILVLFLFLKIAIICNLFLSCKSDLMPFIKESAEVARHRLPVL